MIGSRRGGHQARGNRPQVIRVDLLTHAHMRPHVDAKVRADAADGLRERQRGAAMQDTGGLVRAGVNGHGRAQVIRADLGVADAQVFRERIADALLQLLHGDQRLPDAHAPSVADDGRLLRRIISACPRVR